MNYPPMGDMGFPPLNQFYVAPEQESPAEVLPVRRVRKTFSHTWLCYALFMLLHIAFSFGVFFLLSKCAPEFAQSSNAAFFYDSLPLYLIALPVVTLLMRRLPQDRPPVQKMGAGSYAVLLSVVCLALVVGSVVGNTVTSFVDALTGASTSDAMDVIGEANVWLSILFAGILAPVAEEFIFRKVIIDSMRRFGEGTAIFVSALIFGLAHGNTSQCFYAFSLGLVFGYIYCRSGKLHLSVIPHAVINCVSILISMLVLPRVTPVLEEFYSLAEENMSAEMMTQWLSGLSAEMPWLLVMSLYFCLIYGGALLGFIFLLVYFRKIHLAPSRYFLCGENGDLPEPLRPGNIVRPAVLNLGALAFLVMVIFFFVMSAL